MKVDEIRQTYLSFFEERGHEVVPSASLIPSVHDPSVLLTTAGMQPFKPYFRGEAEPPAPRVADVQRCFRTVDIDEVAVEQAGDLSRRSTLDGLRQGDDRLVRVSVQLEAAGAPRGVVAKADPVDSIGRAEQPGAADPNASG